MRQIKYCDSPIGPLAVMAEGGAIVAVSFGRNKQTGKNSIGEDVLLNRAVCQLDEYFAGRRQCFDLPLALAGTPFQQTVWKALQQIPYGETCSYGDIARRIGKPRAGRAVGGANHQNPIPVIIPCHRVIGADGSLTGYGGGLTIKEKLLKLEKYGKI